MKKHITTIAAVAFLVVSVFFIAGYKSRLFFLPAQQVELSHGVEYGAVLKGFLFVQEITMQKRYINRMDIYMAKLPNTYPNDNVFLLLDEQHRILFTKRFSSTDFGEALYFQFPFGKNFDIGKGKKIYACIHSINGDQGSYVGLARKENSKLGKLYVVSIVNDDIVQSFEKQQSLVNFTGSIGARTFESDTCYFSFLQIVLYILVLAVALLLFFSRQVGSYIRRSHVMPEYAFLGISLTFGMLMLVITPPFLVPDEPAHFFRSYQIAEFNFFNSNSHIPKSLVELSSICDRMKFNTHEKTTREEILALANIKLNPSVRVHVDAPTYTIPYLPQALGIFAGKIFQLNPFWLFYLGRLFNLIVSLFLVFLAIRTTPVLKWLFFLLGIMPMTLYQFASLSYDAVTIGLSFLLIATLLNDAFNAEKRIGTRELVILFLLSGLLAAGKPPYFMIAFAYLIIPVAKIGSRKKFLLVFAGLVSVVVIVSQLGSPGRLLLEQMLASTSPAAKTVAVFPAEETIPQSTFALRNPLAASLPLLPHTVSSAPAKADQPVPAAVNGQPARPSKNDTAGQKSTAAEENPVNATAQKQYILDDPFRYAGIMFNTFFHSIGLYVVSFVGLFGFVDAPLPTFLALLYLFLLLFVSVFSPTRGIRIGFLRKVVFFAVFAACYVLVETAMYLYCNPVGSNLIIAVQGRYFIALGPLLFLLFVYAATLGFVQKAFGTSSKKKAVVKVHPKQARIATSPEEMFLPKAIPWLALVIGLTTLVYSVYVILERFYVIVM